MNTDRSKRKVEKSILNKKLSFNQYFILFYFILEYVPHLRLNRD